MSFPVSSTTHATPSEALFFKKKKKKNSGRLHSVLHHWDEACHFLGNGHHSYLRTSLRLVSREMDDSNCDVCLKNLLMIGIGQSLDDISDKCEQPVRRWARLKQELHQKL